MRRAYMTRPATASAGSPPRDLRLFLASRWAVVVACGRGRYLAMPADQRPGHVTRVVARVSPSPKLLSVARRFARAVGVRAGGDGVPRRTLARASPSARRSGSRAVRSLLAARKGSTCSRRCTRTRGCVRWAGWSSTRTSSTSTRTRTRPPRPTRPITRCEERRSHLETTTNDDTDDTDDTDGCRVVARETRTAHRSAQSGNTTVRLPGEGVPSRWVVRACL